MAIVIFITIVDHFTRYSWIILVLICDAYNYFVSFQIQIEFYLDHKIIYFQTDWGGKFSQLKYYFQLQGMTHCLACRQTHTNKVDLLNENTPILLK